MIFLSGKERMCQINFVTTAHEVDGIFFQGTHTEACRESDFEMGTHR